MNTTTAAEKLGISVATIRRWCRTGRIQAVKVGRAWSIDPASLPTHSEEPVVTPPQEPTEIKIEVNGNEILLFAQRRRFGRHTEDGPARWAWCIDGYDYSEVSYQTAAAAEAAAKRQLGLDSSHSACIGCGKAATMHASLGPACSDCYDNHAG